MEGKTYITYIGKNPPTSHPFLFGRNDFERIVYRYPTFTEEELLKKYNLARIKGYYTHREFYPQDHRRWLNHYKRPDFEK